MALTAVIRRLHAAELELGRKGFLDPKQDRVVTTHGFRSTFRNGAADKTSYPREVCEHALAHKLPDSIYGNGGNDYIDGGDNNDHLYGESGNDILVGGDGEDYLYGGDGNDLIYADSNTGYNDILGGSR